MTFLDVGKAYVVEGGTQNTQVDVLPPKVLQVRLSSDALSQIVQEATSQNGSRDDSPITIQDPNGSEPVSHCLS